MGPLLMMSLRASSHVRSSMGILDKSKSGKVDCKSAISLRMLRSMPILSLFVVEALFDLSADSLLCRVR